MKRILLAATAVVALATGCGTTDGSKEAAPSTAATTEPSTESKPANDVYLYTCTEFLPIFASRAELGESPESQTEFADAMLAQLKQSPEWATKKSTDQADATRGVYAAAAGKC